MTTAPDTAALVAENSRLSLALDAALSRETVLTRELKDVRALANVAQANLLEISTAVARGELKRG